MSRRYGGRYSPPGTPPGGSTSPRFAGRRAERAHIAARLMYLAAIPYLVAAILALGGPPMILLAKVLGLALMVLSAVLLNEGLRAQAAYEARTVARPPAIPRKAFAIAATTLGVGVTSMIGAGDGILGGAVTGGIAGAAQWLAFGLDPMRRKGVRGASDFENERVAKAIDSAEATVSEIIALARSIGDRHLEARVERMATAVRDVFRTIEADPRDLTRARRFIGVYLTGARDATAKFAELYRREANAEARADYEALLDDMETSFRQHREDLLKDDKVALDVEIEVLRERLSQEGV